MQRLLQRCVGVICEREKNALNESVSQRRHHQIKSNVVERDLLRSLSLFHAPGRRLLVSLVFATQAARAHFRQPRVTPAGEANLADAKV